MSNENKIIVKCPKCKKEIEYSLQNVNRPFCSERCKLIDLGAWAEERYTVPVEDIAKAMQELNIDPESEFPFPMNIPTDKKS